MRDKFSTAIYCNFCGRGANEVRKMIASPGPDQAHICDGCIAGMANNDVEIDALEARVQSVMKDLSKLSCDAAASNERRHSRCANELRYAANRAWRELSGVLDGPFAERNR